MTVRGNEISIPNLIIGCLGGCITIIVSYTAYYIKDTNERVRALESSNSGIVATQESTTNEMVYVRSLLMDHITTDKN
jgi:hypothetical protein